MASNQKRLRMLLAGIIVTVAIGLAGCTSGAVQSPPGSSPATPPASADPGGPTTTHTVAGADSPAVLTGAAVKSAVARLPHRSVAAPPPMRIAPGLVPPTNRWFSGLVFGAQAEQVFPMPLSFQLTPQGFEFGLPTPTVAGNSIVSTPGPLLTIGVGTGQAELTGYDDVSATVGFGSRGSDGAVTIAEGSPVISYTAKSAGTLSLGSPFTAQGTDSHGRRVLAARVSGRTFVAVAPSGSAASSGSIQSIRLAAGQSALFIGAPTASAASPLALADAVSGPLQHVTTSYSVTGRVANTRLDYAAAGGSAVVGILPDQQAGLSSPCRRLGSYSTVYGTMQLCAGSDLAWHVPTVQPSDTLQVSHLTSADRSAIVAQLGKDLTSTVAEPADTYYGGKAMYRIANLLQLARALGQNADARKAETLLATRLEQWTSPGGCSSATAANCFVYDPAVHGLVGQAASFGSDQFNDHHFHYGYFFYAAAVLATVDPGTVAKIEPVMNLLAADLATSGSDGLFPERRTFDPYTGHSWAAGYAPFADGNDEESSSEATDAWNGLSLWAAASHQTALETEARWMLSDEAYSAVHLWLDPAVPAGLTYQHPYLGINWGDKRDFASWFSPLPSSILAIQLIPMSPASTYVDDGASVIAKNLAAAEPHGTNVLYGDYLLMYRSLESTAAARQAKADIASLSPKNIDDGDSRAYLMAFVDSRADG